MRRSATFVAILKEWRERKVSDDDASRQEDFVDTVISNDSTDENITLLLQKQGKEDNVTQRVGTYKSANNYWRITLPHN
ncbi:hypothetical protein NC651_000337 [Populus alba x Populus x berolinensis]|nr:hypothetical protein NC651_000337 [Populus alba x Populus x berolinensis]